MQKVLNETPQPGHDRKPRNLPSTEAPAVYKPQLEEHRAPYFGGQSFASAPD